MVKSAPAALLALALVAGSATGGTPRSEPPRSHPINSSDVPDIEIIEVGYGGTGCPSFPMPSATVILGADKRSFTILFDQYVAQTFGLRWSVRKTCNIAASLRIPPGFSVTLLQIDYRGYVNVPQGGRGWLRAEYFFAGQTGPAYWRQFDDGEEETYTFMNVTQGVEYSPCGADVIARANTSILAEKAAPGSEYDATVTVDTADLRGGIVYHIDYAECEEAPPGGR